MPWFKIQIFPLSVTPSRLIKLQLCILLTPVPSDPPPLLPFVYNAKFILKSAGAATNLHALSTKTSHDTCKIWSRFMDEKSRSGKWEIAH